MKQVQRHGIRMVTSVIGLEIKSTLNSNNLILDYIRS